MSTNFKVLVWSSTIFILINTSCLFILIFKVNNCCYKKCALRIIYCSLFICNNFFCFKWLNNFNVDVTCCSSSSIIRSKSSLNLFSTVNNTCFLLFCKTKFNYKALRSFFNFFTLVSTKSVLKDCFKICLNIVYSTILKNFIIIWLTSRTLFINNLNLSIKLNYIIAVIVCTLINSCFCKYESIEAFLITDTINHRINGTEFKSTLQDRACGNFSLRLKSLFFLFNTVKSNISDITNTIFFKKVLTSHSY